MGCNWDESGIIPGSERDLLGIKSGLSWDRPMIKKADNCYCRESR